jgi:hypothetical protein
VCGQVSLDRPDQPGYRHDRSRRVAGWSRDAAAGENRTRRIERNAFDLGPTEIDADTQSRNHRSKTFIDNRVKPRTSRKTLRIIKPTCITLIGHRVRRVAAPSCLWA